MPGSRIPGPEGKNDSLLSPDAGTLARATSQGPGLPGPGAEISSLSSEGVNAMTAEIDPEIEALDLEDIARSAAYALRKAHPAVRLTSGRRSREDQARAMASNVVQNRKWIEQTYAPSPLCTRCQEWVDKNPGKKTEAEIAEGLLSVLNGASDEELGKFSKHLSGKAFDVQPVDKDAEAIKTAIRGLPGLDKFLDREGGLVRWHAQFK